MRYHPRSVKYKRARQKANSYQLRGEVFETSIYSELVKKYGAQKVFYWRTTDKKEIDFIVNNGAVLLPIEAKLNFGKADSGSMKYFSSEYETTNYHTVALYGDRGNTDKKIYPWEL